MKIDGRGENQLEVQEFFTVPAPPFCVKIRNSSIYSTMPRSGGKFQSTPPSKEPQPPPHGSCTYPPLYICISSVGGLLELRLEHVFRPYHGSEVTQRVYSCPKPRVSSTAVESLLFSNS
jgi:hypothetical protein